MTGDLHHLAAAYALDALDADERREFEAHYPSCDICRDEVREFRATAAVLAEATPAEPAPELRDRVLAQISLTRQVGPSIQSDSVGGETIPPQAASSATGSARRATVVQGRFGPRSSRIVMAAAAALLLIAGVLVGANLGDRQGLDPVDEVVLASDAVLTQLVGDSGTIQVIWSAERDEVAVFANGLPDAGLGKQYALWFLLDEGVAPAALFDADGDDGVVRRVLAVDDLDTGGWGITIEPEGGSPQPTGPVIFAGTI